MLSNDGNTEGLMMLALGYRYLHGHEFYLTPKLYWLPPDDTRIAH